MVTTTILTEMLAKFESLSVVSGKIRVALRTWIGFVRVYVTLFLQ
jgi:hypothetical protein